MRYFSRVSTLKSNLMKPIASERYSQNWLPSQDTRLVQTRRLRYFTKWPSWGSNRLPISTVPNLSTVKIFFEYKILHDFFTIQAPLQTNPGLTKSGTSVNPRFFFYTHRRRRSTPIQRAQHLPFERKKNQSLIMSSEDSRYLQSLLTPGFIFGCDIFGFSEDDGPRARRSERIGQDQMFRTLKVMFKPVLPDDVKSVEEIQAWIGQTSDMILDDLKHSQKWHCVGCGEHDSINISNQPNLYSK